VIASVHVCVCICVCLFVRTCLCIGVWLHETQGVCALRNAYCVIVCSQQGLVPCTGCAGGCYQCGDAALQPGANPAIAWDMGEIYGLTDPTRLPAPTTSSLSRTVVMWPESGLYARLHIEDAERSQGMEAGHTALPPGECGSLTPAQIQLERFKCVGNALHGEVCAAFSQLSLVTDREHSSSTAVTDVQVIGELFHRMKCTREYPSRLMTADLSPVHGSLQPGVLNPLEPSTGFPRAGLYKGGKYYALQGIEGNIVNVRLSCLKCLCVWRLRKSLYSMTSVELAETAGDSGAVATGFPCSCTIEDSAATPGATQGPRARSAREGRRDVVDRDDAQPALLCRKPVSEPCSVVLCTCMRYLQETGVLTSASPRNCPH
jgi:hypothetical protein